MGTASEDLGFQGNLHDLILRQSGTGLVMGLREAHGMNTDGSNLEVANKDVEKRIMEVYGNSPVAQHKYQGNKDQGYGKLPVQDKSAVDLYIMDKKMLPENASAKDVDTLRDKVVATSSIKGDANQFAEATTNANLFIGSAIKHRLDQLSPDYDKKPEQQIQPEQKKPEKKTHEQKAKPKQDEAKSDNLLVSNNPTHLRPFNKSGKGPQPFLP